MSWTSSGEVASEAVGADLHMQQYDELHGVPHATCDIHLIYLANSFCIMQAAMFIEPYAGAHACEVRHKAQQS